MAEKKRRTAADLRLTEQDASARQAHYALELKQRLEAAIEGDAVRLRAVARARRTKGGGR